MRQGSYGSTHSFTVGNLDYHTAVVDPYDTYSTAAGWPAHPYYSRARSEPRNERVASRAAAMSVSGQVRRDTMAGLRFLRAPWAISAPGRQDWFSNRRAIIGTCIALAHGQDSMKRMSVRVAALLVAGMAGLGCNHSGLHRGAGQTDAACEGGAPAGCDGEESAGYSDVRYDSTGRARDSADDASILGNCITADDCIAVLDYRNGFECWLASPASKADVSRDPCLVPWKPDARCTTSAPPPGCPSGLQPVTHSCFVTACVFSVCTEGKCSTKLGFNNECDTADAGSRPSDCEDLRTTYLNALSAAQQCYPTMDPTECWGHSPDACGCDVPYDGSGVCADAVSSALADLQNAQCPFPSCGNTCVTPTAAGATCVPNATGTTGICAWQ